MPLQMAATGDLNCIMGVEKVEGKRYYVSEKGGKKHYCKPSCCSKIRYN